MQRRRLTTIWGLTPIPGSQSRCSPRRPRALATGRSGHMAHQMATLGEPFASGNAFYNWFSDCAHTAGLAKGPSPHGLRKAAAR